MNHRRIALTLAVIAGLLGPAAALTPAAQASESNAPASAPSVVVAAKSYKLTGKIKKAPAGATLLAASGNTVTKLVLKGTKFSIATPKGTTSLHLLGADGTYLGPVVFKAAGKSGKWSEQIKITKKLDLGTLEFKTNYTAAKTALKKGTYAKLLKGANKKSGKPTGAGKIGMVYEPLVKARFKGFAPEGVSCGQAEQSLGTDCDGDGVLNAVDADDNNNGVLDVADTETEDFTAAKYIPWSTLYLKQGGTGSDQVLNANIGTATNANIDAAVGGGQGSFSVNYFLSQAPGTQNFDSVWIDCGGLSYCNKDSGTGYTGAPSGDSQQAWNAAYCAANLNSGGGCEINVYWRNFSGIPPTSGIWNALMWEQGNNAWAGNVKPNTGTDTLSKLKVGDTYILNQSLGGAVTTSTMSLGGFFVTVPALSAVQVGGAQSQTVSYTTASPLGSQANPIVLDDNGNMTLTYWRPQRPSVPGVDPAGEFMDLGSLNYGLILAAGQGGSQSALNRGTGSGEYGCTSDPAQNIYSNLSSTLTANPATGPDANQQGANLWPLVDSLTDQPVDVANTLSFTFSMKNCIAALKNSGQATVSPSQNGGVIPVQLTAAGVALTGGNSRAATTIYVKVPAAASTW